MAIYRQPSDHDGRDLLWHIPPHRAGDFVREARTAIAAIRARGALPLLVGGTMLYLRALREGLAMVAEQQMNCGSEP